MPNTDQIDTVKLFVDSVETRAYRTLGNWIEVFLTSQGTVRRDAATRIREIVRTFPRLADRLPDAVWASVYRVRAAGTVAP